MNHDDAEQILRARTGHRGHSIDVPLDWTGHEPGRAFDGETIKLFYRVVTTPEHVHDDLPLLIFLQGGPGGCRPAFEQPDLRWLD